MLALQKMRARRRPGNQAHVTNWRENPALMAADAAEAALRAFDELETTCRVARMAPFNALAILIGSQTPHGGVLTQCAVEEGLNLRLGLKGLTSYAETLSVYGTDEAMRDGDDTPWSKGFLASEPHAIFPIPLLLHASQCCRNKFGGTREPARTDWNHKRKLLP